jgi:hypothetical protein
MKPLVTFADPEAAMKTYLESAFAPRSETYKPATISTAFPTAALTKSPLKTHLQIELEHGGASDYPVTERAQVRFTCYAPPGERGAVKNLATLTQGLVYTHPGSATVAGTRPQVGRSDVIEDPTTKNLMVWFGFYVDLKATQLAS